VPTQGSQMIYATHHSRNWYFVQARSIPRTFWSAAAAAAVIGALLPGAPAAQPSALARPADPPSQAARWREAPDFVALFVPRPYRAAYRAFVSPLGLDAALRTVASDEHSLHPPGAWIPRRESPPDAFGAGGPYDRWKLARVFGSRQPEVARGPRGGDGLVDESWTLVSPYPSPDLTRLEPGTLLIAVRVP
jgi:hypothetical protein